MRLLSRQEVKQSQQTEQERLRSEQVLLASMVDQLRRDITEARKEKERAIALMEAEMKPLLEKHQNLLGEIQVLENRKCAYLDRPEVREVEARAYEVKNGERDLELAQKRFAEQRERLFDREREIRAKEHAVFLREQEVDQAEQDNRRYTQQIQERMEDAMRVFAEARRVSHLAQEKQASVERILEERISRIQQEERAIHAMRKNIEAEKESLDRERKHVQSQQASLRLAFDEARKKNII